MRSLSKHTGNGPLEQGTWKIMNGKVWVACPGCGLMAMLDHEVAADGTVTPSLDCPEQRCAFHEWVRLEGWS
jgi:hypothetical protein